MRDSDGVLWVYFFLSEVKIAISQSCTSDWSCIISHINPPWWGGKWIDTESILSWVQFLLIWSGQKSAECLIQSLHLKAHICVLSWSLIKSSWWGESELAQSQSFLELQIMCDIFPWCDVSLWRVFAEWIAKVLSGDTLCLHSHEDLFKYKSSMMRWHMCVSTISQIVCVLLWCVC